MDNQAITPSKIIELAPSGWDTIIEVYKNSDKEQRDKIIKTLGGIAAFAALLKFLKSL